MKTNVCALRGQDAEANHACIFIHIYIYTSTCISIYHMLSNLTYKRKTKTYSSGYIQTYLSVDLYDDWKTAARVASAITYKRI